MPPLTAKNLPKIRKKRGKILKNQGKKEEKSGRKGKNREGSFTLPLLTDRASYAIEGADCWPTPEDQNLDENMRYCFKSVVLALSSS